MPEVTQAVILAAGRGTRFGEATKFGPKPLILVNGVPIIVRVLRALPAAIKRVVIVVGYKGEMIRHALGDSFEGRELVYVSQAHQTGTASAFLCAKSHLDLDQPTLVVYGDDLVCAKSWLELCQGGPGLLFSHVEDDRARSMGLIVCDADGLVKTVCEKVPEPEPLPSDMASCGGMLLPTRVMVEVLEAAGVTPDQPLPPGHREHVLASFIEPVAKALRERRQPGLRIWRAGYCLPINDWDQLATANKYFCAQG